MAVIKQPLPRTPEGLGEASAAHGPHQESVNLLEERVERREGGRMGMGGQYRAVIGLGGTGPGGSGIGSSSAR